MQTDQKQFFNTIESKAFTLQEALHHKLNPFTSHEFVLIELLVILAEKELLTAEKCCQNILGAEWVLTEGEK